MTGPVTLPADLERSLRSLAPKCEVKPHGCCPVHGRECAEPAEWIVIFRCACAIDERVLVCAHHHDNVAFHFVDVACTACCYPATLLGSERL